MNTRILCVDDDAHVLAGYQRNLRKQFQIDVAEGGEAGLATLERESAYAVVVADMQMPGMNGLEFLKRVQEKWPDTVRMMLTGNADQQTAVQAVNEGRVYRFLNKPCPPEVLARELDAGIHQYQLVIAEQELLENTLRGSVRVLTEVLAAVDAASFGCGQHLRDYLTRLLEALGVRPNWEFDVAAALSQLGYVAMPPYLMQKVRRDETLTAAEEDLIRRVPKIGSELLVNIPRLEGVASIIRYQAKHFDGTGYPPDSVRGEEIPLGARALKVLRDLLELESKGLSRAESLLAMQQRPGTYDPQVLDAAFRCFHLQRATSAEAGGPRVFRKVAELEPGQILLSNIETLEGEQVVPSGNKLTPAMLERIRNFAHVAGIQEPICVSG